MLSILFKMIHPLLFLSAVYSSFLPSLMPGKADVSLFPSLLFQLSSLLENELVTNDSALSKEGLDFFSLICALLCLVSSYSFAAEWFPLTMSFGIGQNFSFYFVSVHRIRRSLDTFYVTLEFFYLCSWLSYELDSIHSVIRLGLSIALEIARL